MQASRQAAFLPAGCSDLLEVRRDKAKPVRSSSSDGKFRTQSSKWRVPWFSGPEPEPRAALAASDFGDAICSPVLAMADASASAENIGMLCSGHYFQDRRSWRDLSPELNESALASPSGTSAAAAAASSNGEGATLLLSLANLTTDLRSPSPEPAVLTPAASEVAELELW